MTTRLSDIIDPAAEARLRAIAQGADAGPPESKAADAGPLESKGADAEHRLVGLRLRRTEVKADPDGALERKADPGLGGAQVLSADDETGVVEALVSVTGVEDRVKDIIEPGAYTKTMAAREPIGVWSHDDKTWVARTEHMVELMPGDPFLAGLKTMDGKPWPKEAGAVKVKTRFNLDTPHGAAAYSDVKFFQGKTGWSIGYRATKAHRNPRTGVRHIKELDWYEYSPVMVGAASQPMTLSVKSLAQPVDPDDGAGVVDEAVIATLSEAEVKSYHDLRASLGLEVKDRVASDAGARRYGKPIGALIDDDGDGPKAPTDPKAYKVEGVEDVRDIMKSWSRVPMEARAGLKARLEAWLKENSSGDEQHRRLNALVGGLGDGDGVREEGEGAGRALANNGRQGGDRWLNRQRAKKGFDDSMIEVKDGVARVRTAEGAAHYGQPIGSIIKPDAPSVSGGSGSTSRAAASAAANTAQAEMAKREAARRQASSRLEAGKRTARGVLKGAKFEAFNDNDIDDAVDELVDWGVTDRAYARAAVEALVADAQPDSPLAKRRAAAKADLDPIEVKRSSASLDRSPRSNWVERTGDLPAYVREVARAIHEDNGVPLNQAIPIAIGRIKKWARGGDGVTAATVAKAAKAVAEWEALKAKARAKYDSDLLAHIEHKAEMLADRVEQAWALLAEVGEVKFLDDDGAEVKWDGSPVEMKAADSMPGDVIDDEDDDEPVDDDEQDGDEEKTAPAADLIGLLARAVEVKAFAATPKTGG